MGKAKEFETYRACPESNGKGMFFYTKCGNRIYTVTKDPMRLHGRLCPKCFMKNKYVTLYLQGTAEAKG